MRSLFIFVAFGVAVLLVAQPLVYSQEKAAAEKVFEGQLTKVDAKTISVKGSTGPEMVFNYDDQTQVLGPEKNVQGLAGKTGTDLKVRYREDKGINLATRIEIVIKAPAR